MPRASLRIALLSRLLVGLLIAGLAMQSVSNAIARASTGAAIGTVLETVIVPVGRVDDAADRFLADLAQSVCSKEAGGSAQGKAQDCHCQYCVPAVDRLPFGFGGQDALRMALAIDAAPWAESQVLPSSRRLPGDGFSRAPPSIV